MKPIANYKPSKINILCGDAIILWAHLQDEYNNPIDTSNMDVKSTDFQFTIDDQPLSSSHFTLDIRVSSYDSISLKIVFLKRHEGDFTVVYKGWPLSLHFTKQGFAPIIKESCSLKVSAGLASVNKCVITSPSFNYFPFTSGSLIDMGITAGSE